MSCQTKGMKTLFIFSLFFTTNGFAQFECQVGDVPKIAQELREDLEKRMNEFGERKKVAQFSDEMLSKLIAAKSPVIRSWFAEHQKLTETEMVHEWRKYFARNFILQKYPQDLKDLNPEVEKFVDDLLKKYLKEKDKKRFEALFKKTKVSAIEQIKSYSLATDIQKALLDRVDSIKLYWPRDLKSSRNNQLPLDLVSWGVAYDPVANEINMGLKALDYPNDETIQAVFAHEIGHAFDSCRWGAFFTGQWPFEKIGQCLRSDKSVGAKKRDDRRLSEFTKKNIISLELEESLRQNPTCNKLVYPPKGTQADQLPEVFADWFSAEVMSRIKNLAVNKVRIDLCDDGQKLSDGSSYIPNRERLYGIYYAHPLMKEALKNEDPRIKAYCGFSQN